jgi:hypothetical protein
VNDGRHYDADGKLIRYPAELVFMHHWSAFTGDWYYGRCDTCGWTGKEVRGEDTARKAMANHKRTCRGYAPKWIRDRDDRIAKDAETRALLDAARDRDRRAAMEAHADLPTEDCDAATTAAGCIYHPAVMAPKG